MKQPSMSYKGLSAKTTFFKKSNLEKSSYQESNDAQELSAHFGATENKSVVDIADSNITPKQKYDYFRKKTFEELKKPDPDYKAVAYYRNEMRKIPRGYLFPVVKKN